MTDYASMFITMKTDFMHDYEKTFGETRLTASVVDSFCLQWTPLFKEHGFTGMEIEKGFIKETII